MGAGTVLGVLGAVIGVSAGALGLINPLQREVNYRLNELIPNAELDIDTAVNLYFRGLLRWGELDAIARKYGYSSDRLAKIIESAKRMLTAEEYISAWLRGFISDEELSKKLEGLGIDRHDLILKVGLSRRLFTINEAFYLWRLGKITREDLEKILFANGVSRDEIDKYELLTSYLPSPSDIIRFAVREVFTPEIVQKYKMYEDLPQEYLDMAKKVGIPEDVAKWYWYAHWELPSLTLGIEMFHRKIISKEELLTLMRTLDIMPYWREKLIQLSYELPTRVDLRRMYELGVITRDELKEYYEKLGYSPEDAEKLTIWTELEYAQYDRDLTVKQILELYAMGEFSRDEAKNYLMKIGYPPEVAEYKITLAEHEEYLKDAKEAMASLKEMFLAGVISYEEFYSEMLRLPFSPNTLKKEIAKTLRQKRAQTKLPSKTELKRWLKLNIITIDEFKDYLRAMGYRDEDIQKYIREVELVTSVEQLTE